MNLSLPTRSFIGPKIRMLQLLAAVTRKAKRLNIVFGISASMSNRFDMVHRHVRSTTGKALRAISHEHFHPFSISQAMTLDTHIPKSLIGPAQNWILQTPSLGRGLLLSCVSQVVRPATRLILYTILALPFTQIIPHGWSMCLLIGAGLLATTGFALRMKTAPVRPFANLIKIDGRPPAVALLARFGKQDTAMAS
jgi:hypothetical protein